jgi:4-oxalocrotonate tautomerase
MPTIHIHLLEGRDAAKRHRLIEQVSAATSSALDIPVEKVTVIVHEMSPDNYGTGGVPQAVRNAQQ